MNKGKDNISVSTCMQMVDQSPNAVYVADNETDELLYFNGTAKGILNITKGIQKGQKCYEYLMHRDIPCPFCHKSMLMKDDFRDNTVKFPRNGRKYRLLSKLTIWEGREAHIHYISDVTALLDYEKQLRTLTDHIPTGIGIYYVYPDGRLESGYLNDGYYKMLGTTREKRLEYEGFNAYNAIYKEDLSQVKEAVKNTVENGCSLYCEVRMKKDDGSYKWLSIRAEIFERIKEKTTLYCVYSDINQLKKIQQEQEERQRHYEEEIRLKTTVSADVKIIAIADLTKNIVIDSPLRKTKVSEYLKLGSVDDVIQYVCEKFLHPSQQEEYKKNFNRERMLDAYRRGITRGSFRHQLKEERGWFESSYDLVLNPYNEDVEAIASLRDVTEMVRSEQVINTLMEIDYESIISIDAKTGEPFVLEDSGMLQGVLKEQKEAKDNVAGVESYLRKYCIDSDLEGVIRETSLPFVKEKLKYVPVHTTVYSLKVNGKVTRKRAIYAYLDASKRSILCARQDITQAYEQEQQRNKRLEKALKEAKEANEAKNEFFAHMSHDMRTPLNGILGSVALARDEEVNSTQMKEYLHDIQFSGDFLLNLINDILDLSKIENGAMELHKEPYTYFEFIENMTKMIEPLCKKKNITLNMNPLPEDSVINVDILRFQQIFFNIFSNAVKYTKEGGVIDHYTDLTLLDETHADCKCHIIDNGIGMSKEFQKNLFQPYKRERGDMAVQGTGLGLSIANELAHLMGGELTVLSEEGKGTEVIIHTILELLPSQEKRTESKHINRENYEKLRGLHILLCEDHPLNAKIAIRLLEKQGVQVEQASNGEEGVQRFQSSKPNSIDLILMDIRMPKVNGLEATKQIRALKREDAKTVPILAMTANAYDEDVKKSLEAGMNGHLAKPMKPEKLYQAILEHLLDI